MISKNIILWSSHFWSDKVLEARAQIPYEKYGHAQCRNEMAFDLQNEFGIHFTDILWAHNSNLVNTHNSNLVNTFSPLSLLQSPSQKFAHAMTPLQSCHGKCKIVSWSDNHFSMYSQPVFTKHWDHELIDVGVMGPGFRNWTLLRWGIVQDCTTPRILTSNTRWSLISAIRLLFFHPRIP